MPEIENINCQDCENSDKYKCTFVGNTHEKCAFFKAKNGEEEEGVKKNELKALVEAFGHYVDRYNHTLCIKEHGGLCRECRSYIGCSVYIRLKNLAELEIDPDDTVTLNAYNDLITRTLETDLTNVAVLHNIPKRLPATMLIEPTYDDRDDDEDDRNDDEDDRDE